MRKMAAAAMLMMMANGCASLSAASGEDTAAHGESGGSCKAEAAQKLVGKPASESLAAEAMRLSGAGTLRWIPHDGIVTMDFREDRLNIELDQTNMVTRIRCG